jgi:hypothetical protein
MNRGSIAPLAILLVVQAPAPGQTAHECPMASGHRDAVNRRGDEVMGFSHERTTHHFRLYPDGGEIEVAANNPHDISSRHQIRIHLAHIAKMFATGDFDAPVLIHGQVPSGVPTLKRLRNVISYRFEETRSGARIRISTANSQALAAIHEFLRFQITDHETGDSLQPRTPAP